MKKVLVRLFATFVLSITLGVAAVPAAPADAITMTGPRCGMRC